MQLVVTLGDIIWIVISSLVTICIMSVGLLILILKIMQDRKRKKRRKVKRQTEEEICTEIFYEEPEEKTNDENIEPTEDGVQTGEHD